VESSAGLGAMSRLSSLPSVERILQSHGGQGLSGKFGRHLTVEAVRVTLQDARGGLLADRSSAAPDLDKIIAQAEARLSKWTRPSMVQVINATGVILHTNLGRAPLSGDTLAAMERVSSGYSNLELDLETGKRGERSIHAETVVCMVTGAEAALVVNNNASAVLLVLSALAARRAVVIARSQLVEIGGGFRMPEVMKQSGARLVEVGTTNRVRLGDYEAELAHAALVMRAHRSNFKMIGFTEEPEFGDVVEAAHQAGVQVADDLGSGALLDTAQYGMAHEPMVQESLAAGADLVCFSGDKLVGGPQAGIIVGKADVLSRLKRHPLARAVRADKMSLSGTAATMAHYLRNDAAQEIPVWRMISASLDGLRGRAETWANDIGTGDVVSNRSALGGGSLPGESFPTYVLALSVRSPDSVLKRLREQETPVIARAEDGRVVLDPRTVQPEQDAVLLRALHSVSLESR
jgi:L-seryl-tRNA(Ser) seleniumtransferase